MIYEDKKKNIYIKAKSIELGEKVSLGDNIRITTKGDFKIGDYSRLGNDCNFEGNNILIGKHFYHANPHLTQFESSILDPQDNLEPASVDYESP